MRVRLAPARRFRYKRRFIGSAGIRSITVPATFGFSIVPEIGAPTLFVELGFSDDPDTPYLVLDDPTRGLLDTAVLAPAAGFWTDASAYCRRCKISRGRQRLLEQYRTGTCTVVLDNSDGRFSPHNLSGPYVNAGVTLVQPEIRIRIYARWNGAFYPLFHGFVDAISPTWTNPQGAFVTVTASDALKVLARFDPLAESSPTGGGELSGARLHRLLDLINWPDGDRAIDAGHSTLQSTTMAQNLLAEAQLTVDSEGPTAGLYVDADGRITFEDRWSLYSNTRSNTVQATFGDAEGSVAELIYDDIKAPPFSSELVKNTISIARVNGAAKIASDPVSQQRYRFRTHKRSDLLFQTDTESQQYANLLLSLTKDAEQRIDALKVTGMPRDTTLWPHMLGRKLRDRVRAIRRPENGDPLDLELFIEGIEHDIEPPHSWQTEFATALAKTGAAAPY